MKKLLTLLFTLCITLIGYKSVYAIDTYSAGFDKMRVVYDNLQGTPTNADFNCIGNRCSSGRFNSYNSLTSLFLYLSPTSSISGYNYLNFNDSITIYSYTNLNVSSFQPVTPDSISVVALHRGDMLTRAGVCSINNTVISDTNKLVGQMTDNNGYILNQYATTFNVSVNCLVNGNSFSAGTDTMILEYNIDTGFSPSLTGEVSIDVVHNYYYVAYHSEYESNLNDILNAIQNITLNGANITVDQSQTTDAIEDQTEQIINNQNNNTQQIVDQLTDESCSQVACSNLFHPTSMTATVDVYGYGDSYLTFRRRWGGELTYNAQSPFMTLQRNKTYYYNIICSPQITSMRFCTSGDCTAYFSCGTGSFTWTSGLVDFTRINIKNPETPSATDYRVDVYISEQQDDFCAYGSSTEVCTGTNKLDNISNSIDDVNDTLNNSDTSDASVSFEEFMSNFSQSDFGFSDFVKIPITVLQTINSSTCTPLSLPLPFLNRTIDLPCYQPIFANYYGAVYYLTQTVYHAIIGYYCCYTVYKIIQDILDPNNDKIKILDL